MVLGVGCLFTLPFLTKRGFDVKQTETVIFLHETRYFMYHRASLQSKLIIKCTVY